MESSAPLAISLLGRFRVSVHGRPIPDVDWRQRRAAAVVKLIALDPAHRLHRDQLIDILWPELDGDAAANNLRVALSRARRVLEANDADPGRFLTRDGAVYELAAPDDVWVDVDAFEAALRRAWASDRPEDAQAALDGYGGDLLPDDLYDDWAAGRRLSLRTSYLALLARLGRLHEERRERRHAIAAWQRLLLTDPLDEPAHAALIALFARVGEPRQAIVQFDRLAAVLAKELGAEPDAATCELVAAIRTGRFPHASDPDAPEPETHVSLPERPPGLGEPPIRLPVQPDELIGRERELGELRRLIAARRLVTLTGPAGVGKTRLALAATTEFTNAHQTAAAWTDLAALRDPTLVLSALARTLGVRESAETPLDAAVPARLGAEPFLLAIDNFEHVMPAAPALADLLAACPALRLIVTSRGPLRIRGEQEYPVLPLAVPDHASPDADVVAAETLQRSAAVDLFVRRIQGARPDMEPTWEDLAAIAEICRRLDGLPLAIELAAARARVLPLAVLRRSIERPLAVLTQGSRDAPDRQRTLRAAIAWSYDLLDPSERTLFSRLAVFAGSFSLGAVTAIASESVEAQNECADEHASGILDSVSALIDQALVQRQTAVDDAPRFSMLLTIRDFAADQLAESGAAAEILRRHAMWFLDLAERSEPELVGPDAGAWLARLEQDHDNLRAAFVTFFEAGDPEGALRLASTLWRFWWLHGHLSEGRSHLDRALDHGFHAPAAMRAKAFDGAGGLASAQGDLGRAATLHAAALDLWRSVGDRAGMANALINLGLVADERGDPERAERYLREALVLARAAGNRRGVAVALANLGQAAMSRQDHEHAAAFLAESAHVFAELGDVPSRAAILANLGVLAFLTGDYVHAETLHETALASMRELSDRQGEADELLNLGHAVQQRGDLVRAGHLFDEALNAFRQIGDRSGQAFALIHLGRLARVRGDNTACDTNLRAGLAIGQEIGDQVAVVEALEGLAMLACGQDNAARCARLLGASSGIRERTSVPLPAVHQPAIDWCVAEARRVLGSAEFATALGEGRVYVAAHLGDASENGLAALAG